MVKKIPILIVTLLVVACGDFYEFDTSEPVPAREMSLTRKVINIVEGDHYRIPVTFTPAEVSSEAVWWLTDDETVARFRNDTVIGVAEGQTVAYVTSVADRLQDSCLVNVLPQLYLNPRGYVHDMVIYAQVNIHGKTYIPGDEASYVICAYKDQELRGIGQMRRWQDRDYMELRVWSPFYYGELIDIRCYYRGQARVELFPDRFIFDGETHGTLSSLYPLVLDETAEEYNFGLDFGTDSDYIEGGEGHEETVVGQEEE
jgi:hypothetical protein